MEQLNSQLNNQPNSNNISNSNNKTYLLDFVIQKFFEEKDRKCRPGTVKNYEIIFKNILTFFKKDILINSLRKIDIKNYENYRLMNGIKESFLLEELKLLKNLFNFAVENEYVENNIFNSYNFKKQYKPYTPRERFLTPDECASLINNCNPHLRRLVVFLLETGTRIKETLNLYFSDIATEPKSNVQYVRIRKEISKSKRERFVPLSKEAMEQINEQKREFPDSMLIFTDSKGNYYKTTPKKAFYNAVKKSNLNPPFGFHTLRHTFASHKLQGINYKGNKIKPLRIEVIAEIMGHGDINLTKKTYAVFAKDTLLLEFVEGGVDSKD